MLEKMDTGYEVKLKCVEKFFLRLFQQRRKSISKGL